jgi:DNA-binding XRE family transcriptional regulator
LGHSRSSGKRSEVRLIRGSPTAFITPVHSPEYIGARMRESRRALGITEESLGELLGVTFQQIQKYESGRNRVNAARFLEICEALDVSLASMFERNLK